MIYFQSFPVLHLGAMAESSRILVSCRVEGNSWLLKPNLKPNFKCCIRESAAGAVLLDEGCQK